MSTIAIPSKSEFRKIYMDLQMMMLISPDHLDHIRHEHPDQLLALDDLMMHFAGAYDLRDGAIFAARYRWLFDEAWASAFTDLNCWGAGEDFGHSPSGLECLLHYFVVKHFFGLSPEMIPAMLENLKDFKEQIAARRASVPAFS